MFFGNTLLIVLRASSLEVYNVKTEEKETLDFPQSIVKKQEILDFEKFEIHIEEFLARNSMKKQNAIMVLASDVIFETALPKEKEDDEKAEEEKLIKKVPGKEEQVVIKKLKDDEKVYLVAANKDYYQSVKYTFEKYGWKIDLVVSSTMFDGFEKEKPLEYSDVRQIVENKEALEVGNFLSEKDEISKTRMEKASEKKESGWFSLSNMLLLLFIALICAGGVFSLLFFNNVRIPAGRINLFIVPTPTLTHPPTPTPTPEATLKKEDIRMKVLNGTGTPGQAGKVKSAMNAIGLSDIQTDNAENQDATDTIVAVSSKVPKSITDEIVKALQKSFSSVKTQDSTDSAFDVVITTGTEK